MFFSLFWKVQKMYHFAVCTILLFVMLIMLHARHNQTFIFRENRLYYFLTFRQKWGPKFQWKSSNSLSPMIHLLTFKTVLNCIYIILNGCSPDIVVQQILNLIESHTVAACTFNSRYLRGIKGHALILCISESWVVFIRSLWYSVYWFFFFFSNFFPILLSHVIS
jgi:hypothetical protein